MNHLHQTAKLTQRLAFALTLLAMTVALQPVMAGPPTPVFLDDQPGLFVPIEGDPNDRDSWMAKPIDWGGEGHIGPSSRVWVVAESPFSDVGVACRGNIIGPNHPEDSALPCNNATRRYEIAFKNGGQTGMNQDRDWVFSMGVQIEIPAGDTFGNDKLVELNVPAANSVSGTHLLLEIVGGGPRPFLPGNGARSSFLDDGTPDRYRIFYGLDPVAGTDTSTLLDFPITEGRLTLHYKSDNQRLDLWWNDNKVLENFQSASGSYDLDFIQIAGGGVSFENSLYDEIYVGVLDTSSTLAGDANGDGVVDVADLGVVGANFGQSDATFTDGDFNGDGIVDVADLGILGANWTAAQAAFSTSALVPEPTTLSLVMMGVLMVRPRRC